MQKALIQKEEAEEKLKEETKMRVEMEETAAENKEKAIRAEKRA